MLEEENRGRPQVQALLRIPGPLSVQVMNPWESVGIPSRDQRCKSYLAEISHVRHARTKRVPHAGQISQDRKVERHVQTVEPIFTNLRELRILTTNLHSAKTKSGFDRTN